MNTTSLLSAPVLSEYSSALLARQQKAAGIDTQAASSTGSSGTSSTSATKPSATDKITAELNAAPTDFRTSRAQHDLSTKQAALGKELAGGLARAGARLAGHVSFSLGTDGKLAIDGSAADVATIRKWMDAEPSNPSLESRLGSVLQTAQDMSARTQQINAISLAARQAGAATNVMSMYSQFMSHADTAPAVMSFDGTASTLGYPGSVSTHA